MTEELIRALSEIAGLEPKLRLYPMGGVSLYPESSAAAGDISGNTVTTLKIRARFKGEDPSRLFFDAESAYGAFSDGKCAEKLREKGLDVYSVSALPPLLESCDGCGLYIVSFAVNVKFIEFASGGSGGTGTGTGSGSGDKPPVPDIPPAAFAAYIEYDGGNGGFITSYGTDIRITGAEGTEPFTAINYEENAFYDGAEFISDRIRSRKIILHAEAGSADADARRRLYRVFRTGNEGTLYFRTAGTVRKIACRTEKITLTQGASMQKFKIALLCVSPLFENGENTSMPLCGINYLWEFDGFELPEREEFEFSNIIDRSSTLVRNGGDVPAGCVIRITVGRPVARGIKIFASGARKSVEVSGSYTDGDIIEIDTRSGKKGIRLARVGSSTHFTDITNRIVWGSEFFHLPVGTERINISADGGVDGLSAEIKFTERFEGI